MIVVDALIFDFDGLLMNTERTLLDCWRAEWQHHGLELDLTTFFASPSPARRGFAGRPRPGAPAATSPSCTTRRSPPPSAPPTTGSPATPAGSRTATSSTPASAWRPASRPGSTRRPRWACPWRWRAARRGAGSRVIWSAPASWAGSRCTPTATRSTPTSPTRPCTSSPCSGSASHRTGRSPSRTPRTASPRRGRPGCVAVPNAYTDPARFGARGPGAAQRRRGDAGRGPHPGPTGRSPRSVIRCITRCAVP